MPKSFCVFLRRFFRGSFDSGRAFFPRVIVTFRFETGTEGTWTGFGRARMSIERAEGREAVGFAV